MFVKIKNYLKENTKIQIAFALLFVSSVLILSQIQDNIKDITKSDLEVLTSNTFIVFGTIVIISIVIYTIVDLFFDKSDHDKLSKQLNDKLSLVEKMLEMKGLQTIVTNEEIEKEEKNAKEIILIVENLTLDINGGKYFEEVHENIKSGKQYTYYLKYDNHTHSQIEQHNDDHYSKLKDVTGTKEPKFILIPSNEYSFFSDIYIYYIQKKGELIKKAFELLPNLSRVDDKGEETLFYLEFSEEQVKKLNNILSSTNKAYGITLASNLKKHSEYIVNQSKINEIEKEATQVKIITDTLEDDLKGGQFYETVFNNLKNHKKQYTYYVPDTKDINEQIVKYKKDYELEENELKIFIKIPINLYLFYSNIFIYDNKDAFEFLSSTNQYFQYDDNQCNKILISLDKLK